MSETLVGIKREPEHNWGRIVILSGKFALSPHLDYQLHFAAHLIWIGHSRNRKGRQKGRTDGYGGRDDFHTKKEDTFRSERSRGKG